MLMNIDRTWPLSPSEQLKAQLRTAIRSGRLRTGQNLPTVRTLAVKLEVNPNTVTAVYRELSDEGLVTKHRRGGTRVAAGSPAYSDDDRRLQGLADRLIRLAREQKRSGADLLRLIAGRWNANDLLFNVSRGTYPIYDLLQSHDHDQA